jgi:hypothetical protein
MDRSGWIVYRNKVVSIQKRGISAKVKEREGCNHRNTLKYFEDYNLKRDAACPAIAFSDGGRLAKRAVYGWTLGRFKKGSVRKVRRY